MPTPRAYIYQVFFTAEEMKALEAATPCYDPESARSVIMDWWHGQYLKGRRLDISVHLTSFLTPDYLQDKFLSLHQPPSLTRPGRKGSSWILARIEPREMATSRQAAQRLHMAVDQLRHVILYRAILDIYGVSGGGKSA